MKRFFILTLCLLCLISCQSTKKKTQDLVFNEEIVFNDDLKLTFESMQILPTDLYNSDILYTKYYNFIKGAEVYYSGDYVLLELVFDVAPTPEGKFIIQDHIHFVIEDELSYPGFIFKEDWSEGRINYTSDHLNTFSSPYNPKRMRLYFFVPHEIAYSNHLTLTDTINNIELTIDNSQFENPWIPLNIGNTIKTQKYNLTIEKIINKPTSIESDFDFLFHGLEITVENKTDKDLRLTKALSKNIYTQEGMFTFKTAEYLLINNPDIVTEDDITQEFGTLASGEKKTVIIGGLTDVPKGFFVLDNYEIYYLDNVQ